MADVTLSNGREITIDLYKMTVAEWDHLMDDMPKDEERALLAKCAGITVEEIKELPFPDLRQLEKAFTDRCRDPLADQESN